MRDKQAELGDKYCENELQLYQAKVAELEIEVNLCSSDDKSLNLDDIKEEFERLRNKFDKERIYFIKR